MLHDSKFPIWNALLLCCPGPLFQPTCLPRSSMTYATETSWWQINNSEWTTKPYVYSHSSQRDGIPPLQLCQLDLKTEIINRKDFTREIFNNTCYFLMQISCSDIRAHIILKTETARKKRKVETVRLFAHKSCRYWIDDQHREAIVP